MPERKIGVIINSDMNRTPQKFFEVLSDHNVEVREGGIILREVRPEDAINKVQGNLP